jgi:hypothetical protein
MQIKSLKAKYVCPKCNGHLERTIDNCGTMSSKYDTILKVMLKDSMKCGVCQNEPLKISKLTLYKDRRLRRVFIEARCKNSECGIFFESVVVLPLDDITKTLSRSAVPANPAAFGLSCPKCEGVNLAQITMHVGLP